jgi:topoisomerase-4 subunit B
MSDLFSNISTKATDSNQYSAKDIEVLEGLEPVRKRPGMYIGGVDEGGLHHLVSEVFDNSMDEAVAGYANRIEISLASDNSVTISDNGRGIPIDPHPKYPDKSALEVILTTLHSGGKFSNKAYQTSGGLHGVGISVVNALSDRLVVEVARDKTLYRQEYSKGSPINAIAEVGKVQNRRGTTIIFHPDPTIFKEGHKFKPARLYKFARSKAYLYKGVEIRWKCAPELLPEKSEIPAEEVIHFPNGLADFINETLKGSPTICAKAFMGEADLQDGSGRVEWAINWPIGRDGFVNTYCNTVPTPLGGTHENGFRTSLLKAIKEYGDKLGNKKAEKITGDDVFGNACTIISLFYREPQFQGQTKEKLVNANVAKLVENAVKDHFDNWLGNNTESASDLLGYCIARAEERIARKAKKDDVSRKSITHKLRLPGKLADCVNEAKDGTELFIVEGDSAGGSAKQARNRNTQAVLPIRGKILNVASANADKIKQNQEIRDLIQALGCGTGSEYNEQALRYDKIIIMTDADVDGAHIASLLMTFFYREMSGLLRNKHLYLAKPPLFRITQSSKTIYANDQAELDKIVESLPKNRGKIDVGRFKGLGEMTAPQLKETTMNPESRTLFRVEVTPETEAAADDLVEQLMGKKPELRFKFIQERSEIMDDKIRQELDI